VAVSVEELRIKQRTTSIAEGDQNAIPDKVDAYDGHFHAPNDRYQRFAIKGSKPSTTRMRLLTCGHVNKNRLVDLLRANSEQGE
jgi:hypothetical protein